MWNLNQVFLRARCCPDAGQMAGFLRRSAPGACAEGYALMEEGTRAWMGIVRCSPRCQPLYDSCCTMLLYFFKVLCCKIKNVFLGFPGGIVVKNLPCHAADTALIPDFPGGSDGNVSAYDVGDPGSIPGLGGCPGEGNGNPLQCSCPENPMDRRAWCAAVHGVAKSWTRLSDLI